MGYYDYPPDVEDGHCYPSKLDIEGERIAMAYDAYVERLYDEWCEQGIRAWEDEMERVDAYCAVIEGRA